MLVATWKAYGKDHTAQPGTGDKLKDEQRIATTVNLKVFHHLHQAVVSGMEKKHHAVLLIPK